jgi:S1-C subfamily serine protease
VECELQFDPARDLEVSATHAVFERDAGRWYVRDLSSRNGTWVDGRVLTARQRLVEGTRVRFGPDGPEVTVHLTAEGRTAVMRRLARENSALRRALLGVAALLVFGGVVGAWAWLRRGAAWESERVELLAETDRLLASNQATIEALQGEVDGLATALEESRGAVRTLRSAVEAAESGDAGDAELSVLRTRLQEATLALTRQQLAASLPFDEIERRNRPALALLFVEFADGGVHTATAFAVRSDGVLVTSRHVVTTDAGTPADRIGVQFSDSRQVWRARLLAVADTADLAAIKVDDIVGGNPVVGGIGEPARHLSGGTPVALLGFPLAEAVDLPRPLVTAGVVRERSGGQLRVQGYGAEGGSGSPVFDAEGRLAGVLYGGAGEGSGQTLLAVPAVLVEELLAALRPR